MIIMNTGIPILDTIQQIVGAIFVTVLLIASGSRMIKMYRDHAYGQLVASIIFFAITYAFIAFPAKVTGFMGKAWDFLFSKF